MDYDTAIEIVNRRMDAYNRHDIKNLIDLYSESVSIYTYPSLKLSDGKAHLESLFTSMFSEQDVHVKIVQQVENGNYVVNEEIVSYSGKDKKYVSIYRVEKGLITEVRFVRED
jgi:hypothetical protein